MLSYQAIAEMTGASIDKVRSAADLAETIDISEERIDQRWGTVYVATHRVWFVNDPYSTGYANVEDRYGNSIGHGGTRQEAMIMALRNHPRYL